MTYLATHSSDQGQQFVNTLNTTSREGGDNFEETTKSVKYRCFEVLLFCEQSNFLAAKIFPRKELRLVIGNIITAIIFQSDHIYC